MVRCSVATKLAAHQRHEALKWLEAGETTREIALSYNVAHTTIFAVEACRSAALANAFPTGGSKTGRELSTIVTRVCAPLDIPKIRLVDLHTFQCAICNHVLTTLAAYEDPMHSTALGRWLQGD
jgi:hypothetical protein